MASAWGDSWGVSWGDSWGSIGPTSPTYFGKLGDLGYQGTINDRQLRYLCEQVSSGHMNDMMSRHLKALGYTGAVPDMLRQKACAEGFSSINAMWYATGLIPT